MQERIRKILLNIGMSSIPDGASDSLFDYGLDSLLMVLAVAEMEKEFKIKIPAEKVEESSFVSVQALATMLQSLGAK